jgi:hypothetical protein
MSSTEKSLTVKEEIILLQLQAMFPNGDKETLLKLARFLAR